MPTEETGREQVKANLSWSLYIECPECHKTIDLSEHDQDGVYSLPIFNNTWDDLKGEEVECPYCSHWFEIEEVVY